MKKIMFAAVSALALSALADGVSSTQFGALAVESPTKRTLVAIPWCEASTAGTAVAVSNLVLTANLTTNDTIVVRRTDGRVDTWTLEEDNETNVKYWKAPETNVYEGGETSSGTSSDVATVTMGEAVILNRQKIVYADGDTIPEGKKVGDAIPFYVMGQVAATAPSTTIIAPTGTHSATNVCYNMIAPPTTTNQYLNGSGEHCATWTGTINEDDRICIPTPYLNLELKYVADIGWCQLTTVTTNKYYLYTYDTKTKKWTSDGEVESSYTQKENERIRTATETCAQWVAYETAIPVGTGFWYVSAGGTPTVTWKDVPTK